MSKNPSPERQHEYVRYVLHHKDWTARHASLECGLAASAISQYFKRFKIDKTLTMNELSLECLSIASGIALPFTLEKDADVPFNVQNQRKYIKSVMEERGFKRFSQIEEATKGKVPINQLSRLFGKAKKTISADRIKEIEDISGITAPPLVTSGKREVFSIMLIGAIDLSATDEIALYPLSKQRFADEFPPETTPDSTCQGVEITGRESNPVLKKGDIFCFKELKEVQDDCLGELCVVKFEGDEILYLKTISSKSQKPGFYNILGTNNHTSETRKIILAAKIDWIKKK